MIKTYNEKMSNQYEMAMIKPYENYCTIFNKNYSGQPVCENIIS